jgi:hypothetical protein
MFQKCSDHPTESNFWIFTFFQNLIKKSLHTINHQNHNLISFVFLFQLGSIWRLRTRSASRAAHASQQSRPMGPLAHVPLVRQLLVHSVGLHERPAQRLQRPGGQG